MTAAGWRTDFAAVADHLAAKTRMARHHHALLDPERDQEQALFPPHYVVSLRTFPGLDALPDGTGYPPGCVAQAARVGGGIWHLYSKHAHVETGAALGPALTVTDIPADVALRASVVTSAAWGLHPVQRFVLTPAWAARAWRALYDRVPAWRTRFDRLVAAPEADLDDLGTVYDVLGREAFVEAVIAYTGGPLCAA